MSRLMRKAGAVVLLVIFGMLLHGNPQGTWLWGGCAPCFAEESPDEYGENSMLCNALLDDNGWVDQTFSLYDQLAEKHNAGNVANGDCSTYEARETIRTLFSQAAELFEELLDEVEAFADRFSAIPGFSDMIADAVSQTAVMCANYQIGVQYMFDMTYAHAEENTSLGLRLGGTGAGYCNEAMTVSDVLAAMREEILMEYCQDPPSAPAIEIVPLELQSPAVGALVEGSVILFEWWPEDSASSYTLTIWQLPEDLVGQVDEGYEIDSEDFIDSFFDIVCEVSFEGIGGMPDDTATIECDIELQLDTSYAWQVLPFRGEEQIGQSDVGFFTYEATPSDSEATTDSLITDFEVPLMSVDPFDPLLLNALMVNVQGEMKKLIPLADPGTCGVTELDPNSGIYRVTYEYDNCIVARGQTAAGGWETTFIFTFERTTYFKLRFKGPCTELLGHDGDHKPRTWSDWEFDTVVDSIMNWKVIGGCPTAISSSYYKRWLYEFAIADMVANGLGQLGFAGFFGDVGQLCRAALAVACPGGAKRPVKILANVKQQQALPQLPPGVSGSPSAAAMGFGVVDGMDCTRIGFDVYQQGGQWLIDVFGLAGAIPVEPSSPPPYPLVHVLVSHNDPIQECNTNVSGEFRRDGTVLTDFHLPFFLDVRYQDPETAVWSDFCQI